ncbi:hypothetical protein SDC9_58626 [bioreactor metagenome]|uniref:Uncharacterized protein n=1 Tax=bioreactor metagenome TaxID=1076179 RepID=A0A644XDJ8_9ZZZZ
MRDPYEALLLLLRTVAAAGLLTVLDALGVQRAADDLVANARQVLHTTAAHEHHRVLLQVVAHTRDVRGHLDAAGEAHTGNLPQGRVRLLRGGGVDAGADATALRRTLEGRRLALRRLVGPALADQLLDSWHRLVSLSVGRAHPAVGYALMSYDSCAGSDDSWLRSPTDEDVRTGEPSRDVASWRRNDRMFAALPAERKPSVADPAHCSCTAQSGTSPRLFTTIGP